MSANTDLEARVQRGIAFLEERVGPDWKSLVDVDRLDQRRGDACVLGQVFEGRCGRDRGIWNGFGYALDYVWLGDWDEATARGFHEEHGTDESYADFQARWDDLQAAWVRVLTETSDGGV